AMKHPQYLFAENIQDFKNNTTRFLLVKSRGELQDYDFTREKTALFVEFQEDRPGLLYKMLSVFNLFGINLCRLESRPSKTTPWMYVFYVDFYNIPESQACLDVLKTSMFNYHILGSYDVYSPEN
ncbi:MAG: prephenate dehydratase, partial [SAR324 cluster bacterium]|nr:prephenate dehydratase [SAR324 cluster bacterium]